MQIQSMSCPIYLNLLHFSEIWFPILMKSTPNWSNPVCYGLSPRFSQQTVEIHQHSPHIKVLHTLYLNFGCIKTNLLNVLHPYGIQNHSEDPRRTPLVHAWYTLQGQQVCTIPEEGNLLFLFIHLPFPQVMKSNWPSKYQHLEKSNIKTKPD